jgi:hypothetical protein
MKSECEGTTRLAQLARLLMTIVALAPVPVKDGSHRQPPPVVTTAIPEGCSAIGLGVRFRSAMMAWRWSAEWRVEWRKRLQRFRGLMERSAEFCRHDGITWASLLGWVKRLRVPVASRSQRETGHLRSRAKPRADRPPLADVRIPPVPGPLPSCRSCTPRASGFRLSSGAPRCSGWSSRPCCGSLQ